MLENASFVHVFGCMCILELTITGWWIIVAYLSIPNWFELQLVSQLASYLFSYFLLRSLLPFSNSKFFLISCRLLADFYRLISRHQIIMRLRQKLYKHSRRPLLLPFAEWTRYDANSYSTILLLSCELYVAL